MFSNEKNSKKLIKYSCESCDFTSSNKNDYTRHINTIKHKNTVSQCFSIEKTQKNSFNCECGITCKVCSKTRHFRSKKHLDFIASKSQ